MMESRRERLRCALRPLYGSFVLVLLLVGFLLLGEDLNQERSVPVFQEQTSWVVLDISGSSPQFCRLEKGDPLGRLLQERAPELVSLLPRACLEMALEGGTEVRIELDDSGEPGSLTVSPLAERFRFLLGMPVNVNRASPEELALLPGIGPKLAERIRLAREQRGAFSSCEDLLSVDGIGKSLVRRIRGSVCFSSPQSRFTLSSRGSS